MSAHAIERAWERYGAALSPDDIAAIQAQIASRRSVLVRRTPGGDVHMIRHAGEVMVAVARERLGRTLVVTFLPPDA